MLLRWSLYYGDGSRFDGNCSLHAMRAPTWGVQILKQEADNERGFSQRHGCNFFVWERIIRSGDGVAVGWRWGGKGDQFGLSHYYETHKGAQKVILGVEIHDDTYHEISRRVVADGSFDDMDFRPGKLTKG